MLPPARHVRPVRPVRPAGLALLLAAALAGCSSNRYALDYTPSPAEVLVPPVAASDPAPARVLVSVGDARRAFDDDSAPFEMRLRMRIENLGQADLSLKADEILLVDADLLSFPAPRLIASDDGGRAAERESVHVAAGATTLVDLAFPIPGRTHPDDLNLEGLNLRWTVVVGARTVLVSATFSREHAPKRYPYHDPFFGCPYSPSVHYGYHHWH